MAVIPSGPSTSQSRLVFSEREIPVAPLGTTAGVRLVFKDLPEPVRAHAAAVPVQPVVDVGITIRGQVVSVRGVTISIRGQTATAPQPPGVYRLIFKESV